jgi:DNA-binding NarL/FixJ family response regulator
VIGVLVIADDPLARAGVSALLEAQPGLAVVGQASGEEDYRALLDSLAPAVVVWDLGWPQEALEDRLAEVAESATPVVVLLEDEELAGDILQVGARAVLPRDVGGSALADALRAVLQGLLVVHPSYAPSLLSSGPLSEEFPLEELTPRELEVLQHLAEGLSNRAIAQALQISEHTVKYHVNAILGKLGARSRTEAAIRAARAGLIIL